MNKNIFSIDEVINKIEANGWIDCSINWDYVEGYEYSNILYYLKKYKQLQSNWNSLREWLKEQNKFYEVSKMGYSYGVICNVLDKMNELEGKDKE